MANKYDSLMQLGGAMSQFGSAMDPNPDGMARRLGGASYDAMQSEIMRREIERKQEEQKKKKKAGLGRMLGSTGGAILGAALAPLTGGASLALTAGMAGLGSAAGGAVGTELAGGDASWGNAIQDGITGGLSTYAAPALLGSMSQVPGGMGKGAAMLKDLPSTMGMGAGNFAVNHGFNPDTLMKFGGGLGTGLQGQLVKPMLGQFLGGYGVEEEDPYGRRYAMPYYGGVY